MNLATPIPLAESRRQAKVSDMGFKLWRSAAPGADANMEDHVEMQRIGWRSRFKEVVASRLSTGDVAGTGTARSSGGSARTTQA